MTQLKEDIDAFTNIARSKKDSGEQRLIRIAERMMDYLLVQLHKMGCDTPQRTCSGIMQNDDDLNSPALEFWLEKNM